MRGRLFNYFFSVFWFLSATLLSPAQPAGYYTQAEGLTGLPLQQALHNIVKNHTEVTYASLWTYFQATDKRPDGKVWDMYSDKPSGIPAYSFTFITDQCGNYSKESDCFNREHSFPKSWFGGEISPMYTDLFHLYPTDGYVNNQRGNYPLGVTNNPSWTSTNGSKLGPSSYTGYTGIIFEPIDGYKGDFARTYFYMATRYYSEDTGWPGSEMVTGSQPKAWAMKMLMEWDNNDPVSQKETDRNEAVYLIQGNRNPFIDNHLFSSLIWGTQTGSEDAGMTVSLKVFPNPADERVTINPPDNFPGEYCIRIVDISGKELFNKSVSGKPVIIDVGSFNSGYYIIIVSGKSKYLTAPVMVSH
jgi:endonuclease I